MNLPDHKAVFLSYASQDAEAVSRIAEALRAAGIEVWFDRNELVGGDAWDRKIRQQIRECALFVPVISAATQSRGEGYFRLEWKLAVDRSHLMAPDQPFLLPVVIDDTPDAAARVADEFRAVQWTRLPGGETPEKFCARVKQLLGGSVAAGGADSGPAATRPAPPTASRRVPTAVWIGALLAAAAMVAFIALRPKSDAGAVTRPPSAEKSAPLTEAQQLVAKARAIWEAGDEMNRETYVLTEELLHKAEKLDPTEASAWALHAIVSRYLLGMSFERSPQRWEALRIQSDRAARLAPGTLDAELATIAMVSSQDPDGAQWALVALAQKHPGNSRVAAALGMPMRDTAQDQTVLDALLRNLELDPENPRLKSGIVNATLQLGRVEEAEALVARWLPGRPIGRILLFDVLFKVWWRGDVAGAAAAIERWPSWLFLEDRGVQRAGLVWHWRREGERLLRIATGFPRDYVRDSLFTGPRSVLLAWAHELLVRPELARAEWQTVVRVCDRELNEFPGDAKARFWKAWALARLKQTDEAESLLRLLEEDPAAVRSFNLATGGLAGLQIQLGHLDRAIDTLDANRRRSEQLWRQITRAELRLNPVFDPLRGDPRFQALVDAAPGPEEKKENNPTTATPAEAAAGVSEKSVAVLAFRNVGGDPANEALVDGIGLELISVLGRVAGLTVRGTSSLSFFKNSDATAQEKGQRLAATYLVDGSIQRGANDTVRLTANLTRAATNKIEWTLPPLSREVKDIFAVQEEIAGLIAQALSLKLGVSSAASTAAVRPEAFECYVQARQAWNLRTLAGFDRAEELLQRALALEPDFARAHAALADVWLVRAQERGELGRFGDRDSPLQRRVIARIHQALKLDPESAEAHAALGSADWVSWKLPEAERALRHAIGLNPSYASAHQWLGRTLMSLGRIEEAMVELRIATELDPLSSRIADNRALSSYMAGRFSEALILYDRALALQPRSVQARQQKAIVLTALGRGAEAVALLKTIAEPDWRRNLSNRVDVLARAGPREEAEARLADVDPQQYDRARFLLLLGRPTEALATLNPDSVLAMTIDQWLYLPAIDPVRSDPRFAAFLATLGLTEAHARAQAWRAVHPPERPAK